MLLLVLHRPDSWRGFLYIYLLSFPRFSTFCIDWFALYFFYFWWHDSENTEYFWVIVILLWTTQPWITSVQGELKKSWPAIMYTLNCSYNYYNVMKIPLLSSHYVTWPPFQTHYHTLSYIIIHYHTLKQMKFKPSQNKTRLQQKHFRIFYDLLWEKGVFTLLSNLQNLQNHLLCCKKKANQVWQN